MTGCVLAAIPLCHQGWLWAVQSGLEERGKTCAPFLLACAMSRAVWAAAGEGCCPWPTVPGTQAHAAGSLRQEPALLSPGAFPLPQLGAMGALALSVYLGLAASPRGDAASISPSQLRPPHRVARSRRGPCSPRVDPPPPRGKQGRHYT